MTVDAKQVQELHAIELELTSIFEEKKMLERQKVECEAAIQELVGAPAAYKIIGSIMVAVKPSELLTQTKEKDSKIETQLTNLKKREEELVASHKKLIQK